MRVEALQSVCHTTYIGEVVEEQQTDMNAETTGRVLRVAVRQGDHVSAGQLLLELDATQARNALQAAEATMQEAKDGYDRVQKVHSAGVVSDQKMVEIESRYRQAEAALQIARQRVEECRLKAPSAGVVGAVRVQKGEFVLPGAPLISLLDISELCVRFSVPESEIAAIRLGDEGKASVEAAGAMNLSLRVKEKELQPDKISHTYPICATLPFLSQEERNSLLPGMIAKVSLQSDTTRGVVIPGHCIRVRPEGTSVWVAENGQAHSRNVRVGDYVSQGILVSEGLCPGDLLITEGFQKVYEGASVVYE